MNRWTPVLDHVAPGGRHLYRNGRRRVLVGRLDDGTLYAVDNACPHEGYPLDQGSVSDCILTCRWHNFRFDVRNGQAVLGDEAVRTYPVRETADGIEVDLTDPDPAARIARHLEAFEQAALDGRHGQCAREAARVLDLGHDARDLLLRLSRLDAMHSEYGITHVPATAADLATLLQDADLPGQVLLVQQAVDLGIRSFVRRPRRAVRDPGGADTLVEAAEAEQVERAAWLARQRVDTPEDLFDDLVRICAAHFLGFGHGLIYTVKLRELGALSDPDLVDGLVTNLVNATRYDLLPKWGGWKAFVDTLDLCALATVPELRHGPDDLVEAVTEGTPGDAYLAADLALRTGRWRDLLDALTIGAVERVRRFDVRHDQDPTHQDGWLDVTHTLTFADAVQQVAARSEGPDVLALVLQLLQFVNQHRVLDRTSSTVWPARPGTLEQALAQGPDVAEAVAASHHVSDVADAVRTAALADVYTEPIVIAHLFKVSAAAERLAEGLPEPWRDRPARALARLASSPIDQRFTRRRVVDAVRFVVEGKVPRTRV